MVVSPLRTHTPQTPVLFRQLDPKPIIEIKVTPRAITHRSRDNVVAAVHEAHVPISDRTVRTLADQDSADGLLRQAGDGHPCRHYNYE